MSYVPLREYNEIQFELFSQLSGKFRDSLLGISSNIEQEILLQESLGTYDFELRKNLLKGSDLLASVLALFDNSSVIGNTFIDTFNFHASLFQYSVITNCTTPNTTQRDDLNTNILTFNQNVNIKALINACNVANNISFSSSNEINNIIETLDKQQFFINNTNRYQTITGDNKNYISNLEIVDETFEITISNLKSSQVSLPREQIVRAHNINLIKLTYNYYGNLDLLETLAKINNVSNPLLIDDPEFKVLVR